ncbi:multifunctional CCA addition/repair protein [Enterobacteriaceae endosymbiont of Plateumaris consimilis]|uniref:multifunctional CCA addition/repair protein n=1 Tax=Enterobacteriaceae endosymbiont of Plateumaris consimilis TaxID=2675794 RepID=UPI001448B8FE|nr:multifunctional CCA addition/repair protein [Enterobacteriaceae endosymbiont of Plateumaris consimilis]QJC28652.1 multifunctional CCA addition/repair protein [Enterobacteriaceae endosymbiont of Plateumaris consimilis]
MKIYLVGGAVRDIILNLKFSDRDWLVVGADINLMIKLGFKLVGKDFPVFLHPLTHEEYALARTEKKSGHGYGGFTYYSSPNVTLEEDLLRRDLTINAIAQDQSGKFYDPYHGIKDIHNKLLKHVSNSFKDDPLRVLRVARFAAKLSNLKFSIDKSTFKLMKIMSASGELSYLKPERIWKETENALKGVNPHIYFKILRKCGALSIIFPEIDKLYGIPAPAKWHPEIDTGIHTMMTLSIASKLTSNIGIRFAALCHDLGKGITPKKLWPRHNGHGIAGIPLIKKLCERLKIPNNIRDLAVLSAKVHDIIHDIYNQKAEDILNIYNMIDAWRKPYRVKQIALISESDARGRAKLDSIFYKQGKYFIDIYQHILKINNKDIIQNGIKGLNISKIINQRRLKLLKIFISTKKIK